MSRHPVNKLKFIDSTLREGKENEAKQGSRMELIESFQSRKLCIMTLFFSPIPLTVLDLRVTI
jgi:hypothetical protein